MKPVKYKIEFYSFWHAGSGLSGATYADNLVNKNEYELPFIPGKTIKGLLRDAAEQVHEINSEVITSDFIQSVFGSMPEKNEKKVADEGCAFFTNATLSENLSKNILDNGLTPHLYQVLSSTQIDENGQAKDNSLRQMEVTVPLTLYGLIENFPEDKLEQLRNCMSWIKRLGQNRNRGLGSCSFSIVND